MKYLTILLLLSLTIGFSQVKTPQPSPSAKITQTVGLTEFTIDYSRPAMRGRTIMGELVPFGEIWRAGANNNTKISFSDPITIGGTEIAPNNYALYIRPTEKVWEIFFYTKTDNWGVPKEWSDENVAAHFEFPVIELAEEVTSFTIAISNLSNNGGSLEVSWEKSKVTIPFEVPTVKNTIASIKETLSGAPKAGDYYSSAVYYLMEGQDLNQAKTWISKAIAMQDDKYYMYRQQSLILFKLNEIDAAITAAKKSLELAEIARNPDYVRFNKQAIKEWSAL